MNTQTILITPQWAMEMLKHNKRNRPLRIATVEFYAMQMSRGEWMENGMPIVFSDNGLLLDGQHRLAAIVKSNTSQRLVVVTGVARESFKTIDTGRMRSYADIFAIDGITNYAKVSSTVSQWEKLKRGNKGLSTGASYLRITKTEMLDNGWRV